MQKFKIKNWTLTFISLVFFCLFLFLGLWQVNRATVKKELLNTFHARTKKPALNIKDLQNNGSKDLRFYQATLKGHFDQDHIFLLDNKIFHGKVGYEIYVPFQIAGSRAAILVDRGFVPVISREHVPDILKVAIDTVSGFLNVPPAYFAFGQMVDKDSKTWPRRIEFIHLKNIEKMINYPLYPYILSLAPDHPAAYPIEWQIVIMPPARHLGYAFQWFALAFTLLILFVALNIEKTKRT